LVSFALINLEILSGGEVLSILGCT
jgi:hypothetical protein